MNYGVILAGGKGERFWPLSTKDRPKQFLRLTSQKTMLEETLDRLNGFIPLERILVVTGEHLASQILETTPKLTRENLLLEPQGRNTCLALALAACHISHRDPNGVMVVLSSDHLIEPKEQLLRVLSTSADIASQEEKLVTIGIVPSRAETAYGYIEMGTQTVERNGVKFYDVVRFKEKPERSQAQEYYLDRKHLWNSGMFVWRVTTFLKALDRYMPDMSACLRTYSQAVGSPEEGRALKCLYDDCESISVDFAILEKADNVLCARAEIKWDDVGSWLAMLRVYTPNREGNVLLGNVYVDSSYENTVVNVNKDVLVTGFGVSDLVIVSTDKVVLVAHKTRVNEIKDLLVKFEQDEKLQRYL